MPYIGEIRMFAGNFAPQGWAFCDGQLLPISQNAPLYVLIETTYGGDGQSTFAVPDLRGRIPIHNGMGPVLSNRPFGSTGGSEQEALFISQLPEHNHETAEHSADYADSTLPVGAVPARPTHDIYIDQTPDTVLDSFAIARAGDGQPHPNLMPTRCVNFIISLFGIFPTRN